MATVAEIRDGIAANLAAVAAIVAEAHVTAYMLKNPPVPCIHVFPGEVEYDTTGSRGLDEWTFVVQALVGEQTDRGAQELLDEFLAPAGDKSIKEAIESDRTLNGVVDDLRVTRVDSYREYAVNNRLAALGAEWRVSVFVDGS